MRSLSHKLVRFFLLVVYLTQKNRLMRIVPVANRSIARIGRCRKAVSVLVRALARIMTTLELPKDFRCSRQPATVFPLRRASVVHLVCRKNGRVIERKAQRRRTVDSSLTSFAPIRSFVRSFCTGIVESKDRWSFDCRTSSSFERTNERNAFGSDVRFRSFRMRAEMFGRPRSDNYRPIGRRNTPACPAAGNRRRVLVTSLRIVPGGNFVGVRKVGSFHAARTPIPLPSRFFLLVVLLQGMM